MSRKRIKRKLPKVKPKDMKELRKRIHKAIVETSEDLAEVGADDDKKVLDDFQDIP